MSGEIQQSDITIGPDGTVHISFLWDDLSDLAGLPPAEKAHAREWIAPASVSLASAEYAECRLCPKQCGFDRIAARHPRCGDSLLRVSNVGLTMGDEPSIRGTRGSGAIMLAGCPLKCPSCHNPEKVANGEAVTAEEFFALCGSLLASGAHNVQILSPTVHLPALRALLRELKASGFPIPIVLKSSGFERVEEIRALNGLIDIYLPDLKFGSCSAWAVRAGVRNYFEVARECIEEMISQVGPLEFDAEGVARRGVLVRHVEAPLPTQEKEEIRAYLASLKGRAEVHFNPHFVNLE
ncbi:MAG: radical SAM protein [Bdellovibrionota bacterium]